MNILVFNCGSSSLTYKVFKLAGREQIGTLLEGKAHRVGVKGSVPSYMENTLGGRPYRRELQMRNHGEAAAAALKFILENGLQVDMVGHRFVHGGSYFKNTSFINKETLEKLILCLPLAPLHNPMSLSVIEQTSKRLPKARQFVAFDSAFHSTIPRHAYTYCLPQKIIEKFGFRKYGFHGLSYSYVIGEAAAATGMARDRMKAVACHLGTGGASVAAIENGRSKDNSMGYSPLPGLVMSTRSGDIDPLLSVYLAKVYGLRSETLMDTLNKRSGLLGLSGFSSDITDILKPMEADTGAHRQNSLAVDVYVHRLKKYIGGYALLLGGIDTLIFTDDIGVRSPELRSRVCKDMGWCGVRLDETKNAGESKGVKTSVINAAGSKVKVVLVPTKEELVICLEGAKLAS